MKVSDAGIFALALHEGIVPGPYLDSVKVWTFGIGHAETSGAPPNPRLMPRGMPADLDAALQEVFRVFRADLAKYEAAVVRAVTVPLKQHQFDALVSFHFNTGAIGRASLVKKLNAGDYAGAGAGLMAWVKPPELRKRREAERDLFLHGTYPGGAVTVWGVNAAGGVVWKPARKLTMPQFMALLGHVNETPKPEHDAPDVSTKPGFFALLARFFAAISKGK